MSSRPPPPSPQSIHPPLCTWLWPRSSSGPRIQIHLLHNSAAPSSSIRQLFLVAIIIIIVVVPPHLISLRPTTVTRGILASLLPIFLGYHTTNTSARFAACGIDTYLYLLFASRPVRSWLLHLGSVVPPELIHSMTPLPPSSTSSTSSPSSSSSSTSR